MAAGLHYRVSAWAAQKTPPPAVLPLLLACLWRRSRDGYWANFQQRACLQGRSLATTFSAGSIILAFSRHASIYTIASSASIIIIIGNMFIDETKKKNVFQLNLCQGGNVVDRNLNKYLYLAWADRGERTRTYFTEAQLLSSSTWYINFVICICKFIIAILWFKSNWYL
jgi:hypothetical protein